MRNINCIQFFSTCLGRQDRQGSSQRMDFLALVLQISASAQDIKILNMIYIPKPSLHESDILVNDPHLTEDLKSWA